MNPKEFLIETLFPSRCLICKIALPDELKIQASCDPCLDKIALHQTLFCISCGARLADEKRVCHKDTPLRLAAVGRYNDDRLQSLITQLKYQRRTIAAETLSALMSRYLAELTFDWSGYAVVPIPLHPRRERERGFNQTQLLAEHFAEQLHLPLLAGALTKIKFTRPQAETKSLQERRSNLRGSFHVPQPVEVANKKIVLIDDVSTSGTTLIEAAITLKKAGAKNIIGFVMAKT